MKSTKIRGQISKRPPAFLYAGVSKTKRRCKSCLQILAQHHLSLQGSLLCFAQHYSFFPPASFCWNILEKPGVSPAK